MTTGLQYRELTLYGAQEHFTYSFEPGVNVIVGPVGSGKTSLLELMKYTLGGDGTLSPAVQDSVVSSAVKVEFGTETIVLTRHLGSSSVEAYQPDGAHLGTYSTVAGRINAPISDLLLGALGIPALRVPRSRTRPTSASSRLTFFDVYAYLYLDQTEIDRSVVSHLDSYREPKRRATFELLYGLSNATLLDLEVQRGELREALANEQRKAAEIRNFLIAAEQPGVDATRRELERVAAALEAGRMDLRRLRDASRAGTPQADPNRERLNQLEELRTSARQHVADLSASCEALRSLVAQLELDAQRLQKSLGADAVLSGLEFAICPRCLQSVAATRADAGDCYVCLQRENPGDARERLREEHVRVEEQRQETVDLLEEDEAELRRARARVEELDEQIAVARVELDQATAQYVSPRFAAVQEAGSEVGRLEARLTALQSVMRLWEQFGSLEDESRRLQARLAEVDAAITEARASLSAGLERVATLSELFAETLVQFQLPWLETASISAQSYLPVINGRSFEELLSGGMKTLVNDAYHLAALRYALVYADSLMPLIQILDSPRKNLGSGPDDRVLAENLYRRIRALEDSFGPRFQIIVADNDLPRVAREFRAITLSYETPGVPFAQHPGPEAVESIGAERT
jgi:DNA repair exonuclease SbcCD ATPase subunit